MAENVADVLETFAAGSEVIYGPARDSLSGFPMARRGSAFSAGAEAHLTGTLAVCAGSCGPGNST
jgi:pyruvate dehydrogenase (quinone)